MTIYNKPNYRKIYEQYYGPIPKDDEGRSYEIHHIDGNHSNNDPLNLKAVTIKEHYDIHYSQGDFGACGLMVAQKRLFMTGEEFSNLARKSALARSEQGTHNWQNSDLAREKNLKRIVDGTHHFIGENNPVYKQTKEGKNAFTGGSIQRETANRLLAKGTHHFLDKEAARKRAIERSKNGTHNLKGANSPHNIKISCVFCKKEVGKPTFGREHGDKCKKKPTK